MKRLGLWTAEANRSGCSPCGLAFPWPQWIFCPNVRLSMLSCLPSRWSRVCTYGVAVQWWFDRWPCPVQWSSEVKLLEWRCSSQQSYYICLSGVSGCFLRLAQLYTIQVWFQQHMGHSLCCEWRWEVPWQLDNCHQLVYQSPVVNIWTGGRTIHCYRLWWIFGCLISPVVRWSPYVTM